ncbi:MAG TPA: hypothetical protein VIE89_35985 [Candidatus Binatia bacterium]|jgi:hypothetical protein
MPFVKGQSGNPGGKKKALGLSRHVRASQGLETWARLLQIRDGLVLERKQVGVNESGEPIMVDVVADVKELVRVCQIILSYCWGLPAQKINLDSEEGKAFAFAVLVNPDAEAMLKNEQRAIQAPLRSDGVGFDFGS